MVPATSSPLMVATGMTLARCVKSTELSAALKTGRAVILTRTNVRDFGVTPTNKHHGSLARREGSAPAAPRSGAGREPRDVRLGRGDVQGELVGRAAEGPQRHLESLARARELPWKSP